MKELKIGILYLGLHNQLIKKFGAGSEITRKEFDCKIGKHGQIPKKLKPIVLREMELKGLIKKVNRDIIKLLPLEIDLENDCYKLFQLVGLIEK